MKKLNLSNGLCKICQNDTESIEHLFFECQSIKDIWDMLKNSVRTKTGMDIQLCTLDTILFNVHGMENYSVYINTLISSTLWIIWKRRNKCKFENILETLDSTNNKIKRELDFIARINDLG